MKNNDCPLCGCSLRNHTDTACNKCGKCEGATYERRRKSVRLPMPPTLELLEPLLNALGEVWSNHYVDSRDPSRAWCELNPDTGHAGRVGMTEEEAAEEVVRGAVYELKRLRERLENVVRAIQKAERLAQGKRD